MVRLGHARGSATKSRVLNNLAQCGSHMLSERPCGQKQMLWCFANLLISEVYIHIILYLCSECVSVCFILSLFERNKGSTAAGLSGKHGDLALQPVDKAMWSLMMWVGCRAKNRPLEHWSWHEPIYEPNNSWSLYLFDTIACGSIHSHV